MTINYPYPTVVKVFYTFNNLEHIHTVGVRPAPTTMLAQAGLNPALYLLEGFDGTEYAFDDFVTGYVEAPAYLDTVPPTGNAGFAWLFGGGTSFTRAELWRFPEQSLDGQFLCAVDLDFVGRSPIAGVSLLQTTYTMRSSEGGTLRLTCMEAGQTAEFNQAPFTPLSNREKTFLNKWYLSQNTPVIARDGGRAVAFLKRSNGQNEALFKKRHRP